MTTKYEPLKLMGASILRAASGVVIGFVYGGIGSCFIPTALRRSKKDLVGIAKEEPNSIMSNICNYTFSGTALWAALVTGSTAVYLDAKKIVESIEGQSEWNISNIGPIVGNVLSAGYELYRAGKKKGLEERTQIEQMNKRQT